MATPRALQGRMVRRGDGPASPANIANIITVIRILLAPLFFWLLFADGGQYGPARYAAAGLFLLAIATDSLDGVLARRNHLITNIGKLLDPIADKLLTGGALVCLSMLGELAWWVTAVILLRELGVTVYRIVVARRRVIPAAGGGKLKTVLQAVAITAFLTPLWTLLGDWVHTANAVLMAAALVATLWSGLDFVIKAARGPRPPAPHADLSDTDPAIG